MKLTEKKIKQLINEVLSESKIRAVKKIINKVINELLPNYPGIIRDEDEWMRGFRKGDGRWRIKFERDNRQEFHIFKQGNHIKFIPIGNPAIVDGWWPWGVQTAFSYDDIIANNGHKFGQTLKDVFHEMYRYDPEGYGDEE